MELGPGGGLHLITPLPPLQCAQSGLPTPLAADHRAQVTFDPTVNASLGKEGSPADSSRSPAGDELGKASCPPSRAAQTRGWGASLKGAGALPADLWFLTGQ